MNKELEFQRLAYKSMETLGLSELESDICKQYFKHYLRQSITLQSKLIHLTKKYNDETIDKYLGPNSYPDYTVHMSLGHGIDNKDLFPMLDNDGGIYPTDQEIGQICEDPYNCTVEECCKISILWSYNYKEVDIVKLANFHSLIFYGWLSINWIIAVGEKSEIVVKTTENNSCMSYYLNDFKFDRDSKFEGENNWRQAIKNFTIHKIEVFELFNYLSKQTIEKNAY